MEVLIGLEIHEQINTKSKLYCDCPTNYRDVSPNTNVCEICTGCPGAKPMPPNQDALDAVIAISLMLDCEVLTNRPVYIQRKHYDYPDLPSGYQRTSLPIGINGKVNGTRIREVHMEEDPGQYDPVSGIVDYNRSGVPLVEITTEPDLRSPEEARLFLRALYRILDFSGKAREEPGTLRVDANISMAGGARVEIKNINSVKGVYRALKYEITRQKSLLTRGEAVRRETRAYLESQMITVPMRTKELEADYRYIPDPDIFPLVIDSNKVEAIKASLPEAPHMREKRLIQQYGIAPLHAKVLTSELALADLFEAVAKKIDPKIAALWLRDKLKNVLNYYGIRCAESLLIPEHMIELLKLVQSGSITPETGEKLLQRMVKEPVSPLKLVEELKLTKIVEEKLLEEAITKAIAQNPQAVKDYLSGKSEALNFLMGRVMKITQSRADSKVVIQLLKQKLKR
ncbi:MAG: Asp-tRNA(Asn)/Glu-tRNA(Gln) amidotransferase subunit GatB [Euryarchaeota archaeon]|nr:Asp-tRNA(Asn)/Glu-tRNA(Gln) amidotransferase subunit GatB [Euryarchaeota archaeon]